MNFVTFEQLNNCLYSNLHRIPRDLDLVIGIPRSGTMVANLIALYLNLPFMDVQSFCKRSGLCSGSTRKCEGWIQKPEEAKKILLVDDSISSGRAMKEAVQNIKDSGYDRKLVTLAVYALLITCRKVDLFFELCEQPRMFEWNYMHHWMLQYACVDMDGVLCEDPGMLENDDGKRYRKFLSEAKPVFVPTQKVGAVVTCRLEKYRKETQEWLENNHVEYGRLIMSDLKEGADRWREGFNHGRYKGEIFRDSPYLLFIESDPGQAAEICKCSGKQVFCVKNRKLIRPDNLLDAINCAGNDFSVTMKRAVKKLLLKRRECIHKTKRTGPSP